MGVKPVLIIWLFPVYPVTVIKVLPIATIDPINGEIVPLFNPRRQVWNEHFSVNDIQIEGITQIGRATVRLLKLNAPNRILQRQVLISQGQYL